MFSFFFVRYNIDKLFLFGTLDQVKCISFSRSPIIIKQYILLMSDNRIHYESIILEHHLFYYFFFEWKKLSISYVNMVEINTFAFIKRYFNLWSYIYIYICTFSDLYRWSLIHLKVHNSLTWFLWRI